jgi:hypothetical protein
MIVELFKSMNSIKIISIYITVISYSKFYMLVSLHSFNLVIKFVVDKVCNITRQNTAVRWSSILYIKRQILAPFNRSIEVARH